MKKKIHTLAIMLISSSFLLVPKTGVADFEFQPRLETGVMFYCFEQAPRSETMLSKPGEASGSNYAAKKVELSDYLDFISGGGTFFINRLFIDLSGQYTFNGNARTQVSESIYLENRNIFFSDETDNHAQFDRTNQAVSAGYAVTGRFSVYVGYKWAASDLHSTFDGAFGSLDINNYIASGRAIGANHNKFKYEGPFIGVTHGWVIDNPGFFKGLISAKVALAYLRSEFSLNQTGTMIYDSINGLEIEPVFVPLYQKTKIKGDTLGLALGFDWHGTTPIKNLSYGIGISGYRYNFDADDSDSIDVNETAVTFKVRLSHVF